MMEGVRSWVMGVVAVGMLVSLCQALSPSGKVQKVGRFCGGLLLFLAVVTPLTHLDVTGTLQEFQDYCAQLSVTPEEFTKASGELTQELVISQSETCIQKQAASLGANVTVTVSCRTKDGLSVPSNVSITGVLSTQQQRELTQWVMEAFDLKQQQIRIETKKADGNQ